MDSTSTFTSDISTKSFDELVNISFFTILREKFGQCFSVGLLDRENKCIEMLKTGQKIPFDHALIQCTDANTIGILVKPYQLKPVKIKARLCPKLTANGKTSRTAKKIKEKISLHANETLTHGAFKCYSLLFKGYDENEPLVMSFEGIQDIMLMNEHSMFNNIKCGDIIELTANRRRFNVKVIEITSDIEDSLHIEFRTRMNYEVGLNYPGNYAMYRQYDIDPKTVLSNVACKELLHVCTNKVYADLLNYGYENHQQIVKTSPDKIFNIGKFDHTFNGVSTTLPFEPIKDLDECDARISDKAEILSHKVTEKILCACDMIRTSPDDKFFIIANYAIADLVSEHLSPCVAHSDIFGIYDTGSKVHDVQIFVNAFLPYGNGNVLVGKINDHFEYGYGLIIDNKVVNSPTDDLSHRFKMGIWDHISLHSHPERSYIAFHVDMNAY